VKFWDASAIVPFLVAEPLTRRLQAPLEKDSGMLVWWGSRVECMSALARRERDGTADEQIMTRALHRLHQFEDDWQEIDPSDNLRDTAIRLLRVHPLRAAGALQLAAALCAAEQRPSSLTVVTLDERLASAARKEGFGVIDLTVA
jgi:predicted nucleic acid-binding protein